MKVRKIFLSTMDKALNHLQRRKTQATSAFKDTDYPTLSLR